MLDLIRGALSRRVFSPLQGMTFGAWWSLLRRNRFAVDPPFWPRALFQTAVSVINSGFALVEQRQVEARLGSVEVRPPLFILGHWRCGTTYLHNLLALDDAFAAPSLYRTLYPRTFATTEGFVPRIGRVLLLRKRPHDDVSLSFEAPNEDEVALCADGALSPYLSWTFPRQAGCYDRYLTMRAVPAAEVELWKGALLRFFKKLTLKDDRPLVLKSPPHTARIGLLLELFPEARFVHIRRNPFDVFRSTRHMLDITMPYWRMQAHPARESDDRILAGYRRMYDAFFEERALIPDGRFREVAYEDLIADPIGQVEAIYATLGLPGFEPLRVRLENYLESIADFRPNRHAELPETTRRRVVSEWRRSFEEWGYGTDAESP